MTPKMGDRELDPLVRDRNDLSVLEAIVRTLRLTGGKAATHAAICQYCKAGLPPPVVTQVLHRLMEHGHVDRETRAEAVEGPTSSEPEQQHRDVEVVRYFITEVGFERYNTAASAAASVKLAELRERVSGFGLTERHVKMWASLYDYLIWKPGRTIQFMNYGLGFKLTPEETWRYREILFDLGLIERGALESHVMLTDFGARCARLPVIGLSAK